MADLPKPTEFAYRLAVKGSPVGTELLTLVVKEHGKLALCGFSTSEAKRLHSSLPRQVADLGPTARQPQGLMPPGPGPGYRQVSDAAGNPTKPGLQVSWSRAWQLGQYGGARVTAGKYESPTQASAAAAEQQAAVASDAIEQFEVPGFPEAVGVRYLGYAWLWIQPPAVGPFIDQVAMRFGDRVVTATASNLATGSGHDVVVKVASDVSRLARL